jgi:hypothetical protein
VSRSARREIVHVMIASNSRDEQSAPLDITSQVQHDSIRKEPTSRDPQCQ